MMGFSVGSGFIRVTKLWEDFKEMAAFKALPIQFEETSSEYIIFALDGAIVYETIIYTGTVPVGSGVDQSTNDANKDDFETYFKSFGNRPTTGVFNLVAGYTSTSNSNRKSIFATTYNEPSSNAQRSISSSSANDTAAGSGARSVRITYFDQALSGPFTEDVTLSGTSAVDTVATNICFIDRIEVLTVGSGGNNAGTITLFASTGGGGGTVGTMAPDDNQTNWCHHYVSSGRTAYILSLHCSLDGSSSGKVTILKTRPSTANSPDFVIAPQLKVEAGGHELSNLYVPIPVTGPARILLQAKQNAASGTNDWFAGFGYREV